MGQASAVPIRAFLLALITLIIGAGAGFALGRRHESPGMSQAQREAIADTVERLIADAYDLSQPDPPGRMIALYADSGVVSASGGRIVASRDTIANGIRSFWERIGQNMRGPQWIWEQTYVEVLSPTAAVLTGRYHIPHHAPNGQMHDIGGAWTALFEKRYGRWVIVQEHLSDRDIPMADMAP